MTGLYNPGASSPLQLETQNYISRLSARGSTLSQTHINAFDNFVIKGKTDGWWSLLNYFWEADGANLASALTYFKYPAGGVESLINDSTTPLVESDYQQSIGVGFTTNTAKYLRTGFTPSSIGLSQTNYTYAINEYPGANNTLSLLNTGLLGSISQTGVSPFCLTYNIFGSTATSVQLPFYGYRFLAQSGHSGTYTGYTNGVQVVKTAVSYPSTDFGNELYLFTGKAANNTQYFYPGYTGSLAIGQSMTDAQLSSLNLAMMELDAIIRPGYVPATQTCLVLADSIVGAGQGSTSINGNTLAIVSQATGIRFINAGNGGAGAVSSPSAGRTNLAAKYLDIMKINTQSVLISLGVNDINADAATNGNATLVAAYQTAMSTAAKYARDFGRKVIFIGPTWQLGPTQAKQLLYARGLSAIALNVGAQYVDALTVFEDLATPSTAYSDGATHPNSTVGYPLLAQRIIDRLNGFLARTPLVDFPSIAPGASATLTFEIPTATVGMYTTISPNSAIEIGLSVYGYVSSADTVTIVCTNNTASTIDPAAIYYKIMVKANY